MTPERALKILAIAVGEEWDLADEDLKDAIFLGSEALKLYQAYKKEGRIPGNWLLPGETEE